MFLYIIIVLLIWIWIRNNLNFFFFAVGCWWRSRAWRKEEEWKCCQDNLYFFFWRT